MAARATRHIAVTVLFEHIKSHAWWNILTGNENQIKVNSLISFSLTQKPGKAGSTSDLQSAKPGARHAMHKTS